MNSHKTVQRAYVFNENSGSRTLLDSEGRVWSEEEMNWTVPPATVRVVPLTGTFDRWCDVPAVWVGIQPWWR